MLGDLRRVLRLNLFLRLMKITLGYRLTIRTASAMT
jgi:hypothetical protein